ncbi:MAG: UDP-glucose/GDP-mannose dehydrogenase family protein [Acidobacteriia bacterium]|nr:UDP-glucose/GDP-mannose dehydrogenase family protein [Terriglobia bacterium]
MGVEPGETSDSARIAVLGLGYVGCVTAACLAHLGHTVIGIDRDEFKVKSILDGKAPFYEPGLEEIVQNTVAAGRLSAAVSLAEGLERSEIALICVGTPSAKNGNLSLEQLRRVVDEITCLLAKRSRSLTVGIRSTVYPGTCEEVVLAPLSHYRNVFVVSNPEFLREGTAVKDFMEPSLLVVGGSDTAAVTRVAALYSCLPITPCLVTLRTAELIKYACNAFHAVKVAFANEIGTLAANLEIDGAQVMDTLCRDSVLNISPAYLKPGFAFGGSCLPKDLRALTYRASRLDLKLPLLESVLPSNERHLQRAIDIIQELPARRLGVFGLAFKEDTDDLRESPVVTLLEQLIGKGRKLRVFDAHIVPDRIYGSNQRYLLSAIPHISHLFDASLEQLLGWADHLVIAQKPSSEFAAQISSSGLPVTDLVSTVRAPQFVAEPAAGA